MSLTYTVPTYQATANHQYIELDTGSRVVLPFSLTMANSSTPLPLLWTYIVTCDATPKATAKFCTDVAALNSFLVIDDQQLTVDTRPSVWNQLDHLYSVTFYVQAKEYTVPYTSPTHKITLTFIDREIIVDETTTDMWLYKKYWWGWLNGY
jgi:hypothetical protein